MKSGRLDHTTEMPSMPEGEKFFSQDVSIASSLDLSVQRKRNANSRPGGQMSMSTAVPPLNFKTSMYFGQNGQKFGIRSPKNGSIKL